MNKILIAISILTIFLFDLQSILFLGQKQKFITEKLFTLAFVLQSN